MPWPKHVRNELSEQLRFACCRGTKCTSVLYSTALWCVLTLPRKHTLGKACVPFAACQSRQHALPCLLLMATPLPRRACAATTSRAPRQHAHTHGQTMHVYAGAGAQLHTPGRAGPVPEEEDATGTGDARLPVHALPGGTAAGVGG